MDQKDIDRIKIGTIFRNTINYMVTGKGRDIGTDKWYWLAEQFTDNPPRLHGQDLVREGQLRRPGPEILEGDEYLEALANLNKAISTSNKHINQLKAVVSKAKREAI